MIFNLQFDSYGIAGFINKQLGLSIELDKIIYNFWIA